MAPEEELDRINLRQGYVALKLSVKQLGVKRPGDAANNDQADGDVANDDQADGNSADDAQVKVAWDEAKKLVPNPPRAAEEGTRFDVYSYVLDTVPYNSITLEST